MDNKDLQNDNFIQSLIVKHQALVTNREGKLLYNLVKKSKNQGAIVEIGSYKGGSTIILAKASQEYNKGKVYAIDPQHFRLMETGWEVELYPKSSKNIFLANIKKAKVEKKITAIFEKSENAVKNWNEPISLLWIDGDHDYEYAKKDFILWEKHLIIGGIIALHDTRDSETEALTIDLFIKKIEGPAKVVEENIKPGRFGNIKTVDSITYAVKLKDKNAIQDITDNLLLITLTPRWILMNTIKKMDESTGLFGIFLSKKILWLYLLLIRFKGRKNVLIQTIILRSAASKVGLNLLFTLLEKNPDKIMTLVEVGDGGASVLFSEFTKDKPKNKRLIYGTKQNDLNKFTMLGLKTDSINYLSKDELFSPKKEPPPVDILYINTVPTTNIAYFLDNIFALVGKGSYVIIDNYHRSKRTPKSFKAWLTKMDLKPKIVQENYTAIYFKK